MNSNRPKKSDLLTRVNLDDAKVFEQAITRLKNHLPSSRRMLSTLQMYKAYNVPGLEIYQPKKDDISSEDNWCEDIWFGVQERDYSYTSHVIAVFCPDSSKHLKKATDILESWLDWTKPQGFFAVPDYVAKPIRKMCEDKGSVPIHIGHFVMHLEKPYDLPEQVNNLGENISFKPLTEDHVEKVASNWTYTSLCDPEQVRENIRFSIDRGLTRGVFVDGELAAWLLVNRYGALGLLTTMPEYRRRGFAAICIREVIKKIQSDGCGIQPYAYVDLTNEASQGLFGKMGFRADGPDEYYFFYQPNDAT